MEILKVVEVSPPINYGCGFVPLVVGSLHSANSGLVCVFVLWRGLCLVPWFVVVVVSMATTRLCVVAVGGYPCLHTNSCSSPFDWVLSDDAFQGHMIT